MRGAGRQAAHNSKSPAPMSKIAVLSPGAAPPDPHGHGVSPPPAYRSRSASCLNFRSGDSR
jgi:hypothetical protein